MNKLKHNLTTNGLGRIARGLREGIAATEIARSIHRSTSAVLQLAKSLESKQPA